MNDWTKQLNVTRPTAAAQSEPVSHDLSASPQLIQALEQAAARFNVRTDGFAQGKGDTCLDMAAKLNRFGSFVSQKQKDFALKLIEWSKPREGVKFAAAPAATLPAVFDVMQHHADMVIEKRDTKDEPALFTLKLSRRNQDTLVWVIVDDECVGKLDGGTLTLFSGKIKRIGLGDGAVRDLLLEIEANPLETAKKYGRLSGRCCSCGRDLTNQDSIDAGIGPICAEKFGA